MLKWTVLAAVVWSVTSAASSTGTIDGDSYNYMKKYGWIGEGPDGTHAEPAAVVEAIKAFQRFAGIKETGRVDKRTQRMMEKSRCGVPDVLGSGLMDMPVAELKLNTTNPYGDNNRARRYTADGSKWSKNDLTYYYDSYTADLSGVAQKDAIRRAFDLWAEVTPLTFTEVNRLPADIVIEFARRTHSDGQYASFDGAGGTLAHAYFPEDGDAHFDEDEDWTVGVDRGVNLFIVAAHEFGHSLGLGHSSAQGALMYPWYQGYVPNYQLPNDDINGIQYLYGMPRITRPPVAPPKPDGGKPGDKPSKESLCKDPDFVIDDMIQGPDDKTYMFIGRYYYEIDDVGIKSGPRKISKLFPGVPGNFNAVVTSPWSKRTYFFKGDRYWRFYNFELETGYPKKTTDIGIPKGPNAAFVWGGNGQMYIIKGNKYYNFNEQQQKVIGAPKKFKAYWKGVPTPVDGAFQWKNGKTYFFKGRKYWRFNDSKRKVDTDYPKKTKTAWFGCSNSGSVPSRIQQTRAKQGS